MRKKIFIVFGFFVLFLPLSAQIWTNTKRLTWLPNSQKTPAAAAMYDDIHVVWAYSEWMGTLTIYYRRSTDGANTWGNKKRLSWLASGNHNPDIAIDKKYHIHVVWDANPSGQYEVYYRRSNDGGANWAGTKRLTWNAGDSYNSHVAVDDENNIYVVWNHVSTGFSKTEIFFKKSTDGGNTWTQSKRLTWSQDWSLMPKLISHSSNLYVVWTEGSGISFKSSSDRGATWTAGKRIGWPGNYARLEYPDIKTDSDGNIHVVWQKFGSVSVLAYHRKSSDGGLTWSAGKRLSDVHTFMYNPRLAIDLNDHIHVVWSNSKGNYEIYHQKSTDSGMTWTPGKRLTWNSGNSWKPDLVVDDANDIYVFWQDHTPDGDSFPEIYHKKGIQ